MLAFIVSMAAACTFDDSQLKGQLDDIKDRIERLQGRIDAVNVQLKSLNALTSGNAITSVEKNSEGKYVITYKNNNNEEKAVVIAAMDQMVNVPLLGVELDSQNNLYYWTVTVDGEKTFLMNDAEKVPVSGYTPKVSVDADGYWTVNGERVNDANGLPIEANDGESCVFKAVEKNENGDLVITQGNGKVITLPVQQVLNLTLSATINTTVVNLDQALEIAYGVSGANSADAMVAVAEAVGVNAVIDRKKGVITVTFPEEYHAAELAGKAATFKVTVKEVKGKELPELNDEFAKEIDPEVEGIDALREKLKERTAEEKKQQAAQSLRDELVEAAANNATIDIPEAMIETQQRQMVDEFAQRLAMQGLSMEQYSQFTGMTAAAMMEQVKPQAEKRIKSRLVLEAVVEAEKIEVSDAEYEEELAKMAEAYKMEVEQIREIMDDERAVEMKKDMAIQKAVEFVVANAKEK